MPRLPRIAALAIALLAGVARVAPAADSELLGNWDYHPRGAIQPKDFALVYDAAHGLFHLFYTRQDTVLERLGPGYTETSFGHAECAVVAGLPSGPWIERPIAMRVRPQHFDSGHIWAPSIIQMGSTWYMFYTGVDSTAVAASATGHQRIGVAWTHDLEDTSWTRPDAPVFGNFAVPWAVRDSTAGDAFQFRDPFVMADPAQPGKYLMYYVTRPGIRPGSYCVGFARSAGDFTRWTDAGWLHATDSLHVGDSVEESPHLFSSHGRWRLLYTANAGSHAINYLEHKWSADTTAAPTDTSFAGWDLRQRLVDYVGPADSACVSGWEASEYLATPQAELLGAYVDAAIAIGELSWLQSPPTFLVVAPSTAAAPPSGPARSDVRLSLVDYHPGSARVALRIELADGQHARLDAFDLAGRRVARLLDRELPRGPTTVSWELARGRGQRESGVYFIRLATPAGDSVVRVPVMR